MGLGIARLTLTCPKWKEIAPKTVVEVRVRDPNPNEKAPKEGKKK